MGDPEDSINKEGTGHHSIEGLNNTQIILLVLLVSFVTSIATGIVTVTLMDQAPPEITRTINRVVEHTVEKVVPGEPQIVERVKEVKIPSPSKDEQVVFAVEKNRGALVGVAFLEDGATTTLKSGFFISSSGYFVSSGLTPEAVQAVVIAGDGKEYQSKIISQNEKYNFTLYKTGKQIGASTALETIADAVTPGKFQFIEPSPYVARLGQTVVALGEAELGNSVAIGIVQSIGATSTDKILTDIKANDVYFGGPVIDLSGALIGMVAGEGSVPGTLIPSVVLRSSLQAALAALPKENVANVDTGAQNR